jgi:hypothetical protein
MRNPALAVLCVCLVFLQSCYTLTNTTTVKLEIVVPGKVVFPAEYKTVVVRYNNANIAPNPHFSDYIEDNKTYTDTTNLDSIASEIYFQRFVGHLKKQGYFDSVIVMEIMDFREFKKIDTTPNPKTGGAKWIDPKFCLYTTDSIRQIAEATGADLFLSLDFFGSADGIFSAKYFFDLSRNRSSYNESMEIVHVFANWGFYDLQKQEMILMHSKIDTVKWSAPAYNINRAKRVLPPRKDAVLNAADIAGVNFAEFLSPHWIEVERMYYKSGQIEMKTTETLIEQNRWLEAAEIWKKNTTNLNKKIAAKSMFNMALVCEIQGNMDAAIDWAVKSYHAHHKDIYHTGACQDYIFILAQRKLDIKRIENRQ